MHLPTAALISTAAVFQSAVRSSPSARQDITPFRGNSPDGQLVIDCGKDDAVYLIMNGVDLSCSDGPAILCNKADKLTLTLTGNSVNSLSDGHRIFR